MTSLVPITALVYSAILRAEPVLHAVHAYEFPTKLACVLQNQPSKRCSWLNVSTGVTFILPFGPFLCWPLHALARNGDAGRPSARFAAQTSKTPTFPLRQCVGGKSQVTCGMALVIKYRPCTRIWSAIFRAKSICRTTCTDKLPTERGGIVQHLPCKACSCER